MSDSKVEIIEAEFSESTALVPINAQAGMQLMPVERMERVLEEFDKRRKAFIRWLLSHLKEGVHYGFPPGCEAKYDAEGNLLVYVRGGMKPYPTSQWKPKPTLYKTGVMLIADLLHLRPVFDLDLQTWEMFGKAVGVICLKCHFISTDTNSEVPGDGRGIGERSMEQNANAAMQKAQTRAERAALYAAFPAIAELFGGEKSEVEPSKTKEEREGTPATNADKRKLLAEVAQYLVQQKSEKPAKEMIQAVTGTELQKSTIDTLGELQIVRDAILSGAYDPSTGEKVPDNL